MDKSYVSMEKKVCIATGKEYVTDSLLMDMKLRDSFEKYTTTGWGISPEVQEKIEEGFIVFIGCDPEKSTISGSTAKPEDVYRTGEIAYIKKEVADDIFKRDMTPINYTEPEVMEYFNSLSASAEE